MMLLTLGSTDAPLSSWRREPRAEWLVDVVEISFEEFSLPCEDMMSGSGSFDILSKSSLCENYCEEDGSGGEISSMS